MLKKMLKKKNNKGFSLVELIVVILIMAIIAVALAPQVIKYVNQSRESVEENWRGAVLTSVKALAAEAAGKGEITAEVTVSIATDGVITSTDDVKEHLLYTDNIIASVDAAPENYTAGVCTITISTDGVVTTPSGY